MKTYTITLPPAVNAQLDIIARSLRLLTPDLVNTIAAASARSKKTHTTTPHHAHTTPASDTTADHSADAPLEFNTAFFSDNH